MSSTPDPSADLPAGAVLAGKYRIERPLGSGGMGIVAAARHLELGTRVAIKLLRPGALDAEEALERFSREARAASRLRGEHVARVFDVGRTGDGSPYMVMEYLEGQDLDALLASVYALDVSVAVGYLLQACEAVAEAHSVGIVHRDLKPRNLFLTTRIDGTPLIKVLDFGIAKRVSTSAGSAALTGTLDIVGSPPYMSPEQLRASRDADSRSDVWSLGVCLYELATGTLPFDGETALDICATVMKDEPRRPDELRADVPRGLGDVILRCLRKDPAERFPDVGALAEALEGFAPATEVGTAARIRQVLRAPSDPWIPPEGRPKLELVASDTRIAAAIDSQHTRRRRTWSTPIGLALGAMVIAATAGAWVARRPATTTPSSAPRATQAAPPPPPAETLPASSVAPATAEPQASPSGFATELKLAPLELRSPRHGRPARPVQAEPPPRAAPPNVEQPALPPATVPAAAPSADPEPSPPPFALATAHVQIGPTQNAVGTTASNVNRALAGLGGPATACYRAALPRMSAPYEGTATLHLETDDEGVIVEARLGGPVAGAVGSCVTAAVRGRKVPDVDTGRVRADVPLTFIPR